jgi:transcriptional regulator with XRE-family HTH domain
VKGGILMNNNLSENLKKIRKDNNLSQEQLAEELGVSRQAISKWESGAAYPEMDKIIQLCNKFELNIDDLLNKDIREIKGEEISKNNINKIIDSFLSFITDTINLFYNMSFKSKIKCIFEQIFNVLILLIIFFILGYILGSIIGVIIHHLPYNIYKFIWDILKSIYMLFCIVAASGILIHIFKTRYLDYYSKIKSSNLDGVEVVKDKSKNTNLKDEIFNSKKNNIIIRDFEHSEYKFVNSIFKIFILGIKIFLLIPLFLLCLTLIGLLAGFIASFIIWKTGVFFIGLLLAFLSTSVIDIIFILLLLNFIFNRKNDKKKMIWSFISALIVLGISIGFIFIGSLKFDYISEDNNNEFIKTNKFELDMNDNYFIYYDNVEYIEKDIDNIEIEIKTNELFDVGKLIHPNGEIYLYTYNSNTKKVIDFVITNLNKYKIYEMNNTIYSFKVYASSDNINKLKENFDNYLNNYIDE